MTRNRIIRFFIPVIALAITNSTSVSANPVSTPHATASAMHIGTQPADTEILECSAERNDSRETRWACTCNLYSDRMGSMRCSHLNYTYMECSAECSYEDFAWFSRGQYKGKWEGTVRSNGVRWLAEFAANGVCENATKGVDCKQCDCSNPR